MQRESDKAMTARTHELACIADVGTLCIRGFFKINRSLTHSFMRRGVWLRIGWGPSHLQPDTTQPAPGARYFVAMRPPATTWLAVVGGWPRPCS